MQEMENDKATVPTKDKSAREKWQRDIDFLFGLLGATIGLGNIWRFPYLCYKNGGGAFLIPYLLFLFVMCLPMLFLEATLGQMSSRGVINAWNIVPLMKGVGYSTYVIIFNCTTYYAVILAWSLRYIVACFSSTLPWSSCNNTWNTNDCVVYTGSTLNENNISSSSLGYNYSQTTENQTRVSSVTEFWQHKVLGLSSGIDVPGSIQWELLLCLLGSWVIIYFSTWKGIKLSSKVVYFTASFPLIMLVILLVRGVTLDGASDGISYYLNPNMTKLQESQVWIDAATQLLYSYAICMGVAVTMGSYNKYHHNTLRDTAIFALFNSGTSFVSGFAVFSILGHMAKVQNIDIDSVAESGPGLVFEAYPNAIALLPFPQLWGILFFLIIFFLGIDSEFCSIEILYAGITDLRPSLIGKPWGRELTIASLVLVHFIIEMPMITQGGMYVFNIYDNYAVAGWCLFLVGFCECITIGWFYGADRYWKHVCHMLQYEPPVRLWFKYAIKFLATLSVMIFALYGLVQYKPLTYNKIYSYPAWSQCIAWFIVVFTLSWIPGVMIYRLYKANGTLVERWKEVTTSPVADVNFDEEHVNEKENFLNSAL